MRKEPGTRNKNGAIEKKTANQWVGGRMDATRCRCNATQIEIIGREIIVCKGSGESERQRPRLVVSEFRGAMDSSLSPTTVRDKGINGG